MDPLLVECLGVVARWLITSVGAYLVAHHVITGDQEAQFADGAMRYLLAHVVLWAPIATGLLLGLWSKYRSRIKFLTALQSPLGTTEASVKAQIENGMGASVKAGVILLACVLGAAAFTLPACASAPPSYSAVGQKAFNADQLFKDVQGLSETAINLNAATGKEHLTDRDTALVRDFALSAGAGLQSYANGSGTLAIVVQAYHELMAHLSSEAVVNDKLRFVLTLIDSNINRIPVQ